MSVCALDIGGTWTKLGIVDATGSVRRFSRVPSAPPVELFLETIQREIQARLVVEPAVTAIGVSVAGFIDPHHSMMIYNPNIVWLERFPLKARLENFSSLSVTIEVDSNASAIGEYRFGQGRTSRRFLCLTVGTGIGGGLVVDGEIMRFTQECIGDVGHVIVDPNGPKCACGGRGCAEAVAAGPGVIENARFAEAGTYIGILAASLAAVFYPDLIALGGGVCQASDLVLDNARASFARAAGDEVRRTAAIVPARLGALASLIGAACPSLFPETSR